MQNKQDKDKNASGINVTPFFDAEDMSAQVNDDDDEDEDGYVLSDFDGEKDSLNYKAGGAGMVQKANPRCLFDKDLPSSVYTAVVGNSEIGEELRVPYVAPPKSAKLEL